MSKFKASDLSLAGNVLWVIAVVMALVGNHWLAIYFCLIAYILGD